MFAQGRRDGCVEDFHANYSFDLLEFQGYQRTNSVKGFLSLTEIESAQPSFFLLGTFSYFQYGLSKSMEMDKNHAFGLLCTQGKIILLLFSYARPVQHLSAILLPGGTSAVESNRRQVVTQVLAGSSSVDSVGDVDASDLHTRARTRSTALHTSNHIADSSAGPVLQANIAKVELARVTASGCAIVAGALGDSIDAGVVLQDKVGEGDVGCIANATTSAIGRISSRVASPCLYVCAVSHVVRADVTSSDVFNVFESVIILTDTANSNAQTHIEVTVFDQNVGTVGLHGDRVISVGHAPATEGNIVRIHGVGT